MSSNELDKIFHDLSKYIRKEKLILNELMDKYKNDSLNIDCSEIIDFTSTLKEVEVSFNKLNILLKGSKK